MPKLEVFEREEDAESLMFLMVEGPEDDNQRFCDHDVLKREINYLLDLAA